MMPVVAVGDVGAEGCSGEKTARGRKLLTATDIPAYAEPRSDCETTSSRNGGGLCFGVPSVPASCSLLIHSL